MGYVCPVCDVGVLDGEQLANHLAVTASLGREDHLEWLETYAPDWDSSTPAELAAVATEHALEIEDPLSEDAPEGPNAVSPHGGQLEDVLARQGRGPGRGDPTLTTEARQVLEEAMALTAEMEEEEEEDDSEPDGG